MNSTLIFDDTQARCARNNVVLPTSEVAFSTALSVALLFAFSPNIVSNLDTLAVPNLNSCIIIEEVPSRQSVAQTSELGNKLMGIRKRVIEKGLPLLSDAEVLAEKVGRRGGI